MKHLITPILSLLLIACGDPAPGSAAPGSDAGTSETTATVDETARINAWFDEKNEEQLRFSPIPLSTLGREELYDQIDDMSIEATAQQLDWMAATVRELKSEFNYEALDFEAKTSYDLRIYQYEQARDSFQFNTREYVFEQMIEIHSQLPVILMNYHSEIYRMSGDLDYLIKAVVEDMTGYDELYKELIKADLFDISASFVMETLKSTTEMPLV